MEKIPSPSSTSNSGEWLSNFNIVSEERNIKSFKWEITNFSYVNAQSIFTEFFPLGGLRFRFHLFPKGEESRNTWTKYLGLYLEMDDNDIVVFRDNPSRFICSEVVIVNHVDDSQSVRKNIFHRFAYGSNSNGHKEFVSLDSLEGPQSEFLFNGTDLHMNFDVRILEDSGLFEKIPQDKQPGEASASTSTEVRSENDEGVYEGKFTWTINNYSLFAELFKNYGMLRSPPFQIGEALYRIHLECQRNHLSTGGGTQYLTLFLDREAVERDERPFCFIAIALWNGRTGRAERITRAYGRLGVEVMGWGSYFFGWLKLMNMSKFENPDNGYVVDNDKVRFFLHFYALNERDSLSFRMENAQSIWNLGRGQQTVGSSSESKGAEKILTTYFWEIKNLPLMIELVRKYRLQDITIGSKPIKFGQYETRMVLFPMGFPEHRDHMGLCLENLNAETHFHADEMSILVHYRIGIKNQMDPDNSKFLEKLLRFHRDGKFYGLKEFTIHVFEFYGQSGRRYVVDGRVKLSAYVHVVEENWLEKELPPLVANRQRKYITWEVDNFLACKGDAKLTVESRFFEVDGCRLRIVIATTRKGRVFASLLLDPILERSGASCTLIYRFAAINHNNVIQWKEGLNIGNKKDSVDLGNVSDFVHDKMVLSCEVNACLRLKDESSDDDSFEGSSDEH